MLRSFHSASLDQGRGAGGGTRPEVPGCAVPGVGPGRLLDEIFFHGRPELVGIEPASRTWFLGRKANDRSGATWSEAWHDWTALEFVTADAGTGLHAGIAAVPQGRREQGQTPLENSLDVFHTTQEARRV